MLQANKTKITTLQIESNRFKEATTVHSFIHTTKCSAYWLHGKITQRYKPK